MKTSDFDFLLPAGLIAQHPPPTRDGSRLMVLYRTDQSIRHLGFPVLPDYLRDGDLLVVNNTKVLPARVIGHKPGTGGRVELFFLEEKKPGEWEILLRSRRRPRVGDRIDIGAKGVHAVLIEDGHDGRAKIRIGGGMTAAEVMSQFGEPPLPPYISRKGENAGSASDDRERYQTIYARTPGAVAAPTAGLHFTPELLDQLARRGVSRAEVTLHVGLGTFRPVTAEDVEAHIMEDERYEIPEATAELIAETKRNGGRVFAVGSTSVRTLEHASAADGIVRAGSGRTRLFITPPYNFRTVDAIITNFHLPKSTLLMMMSAFAGREFLFRAYAEAIENRYRFFSYGDAMLIL